MKMFEKDIQRVVSALAADGRRGSELYDEALARTASIAPPLHDQVYYPMFIKELKRQVDLLKGIDRTLLRAIVEGIDRGNRGGSLRFFVLQQVPPPKSAAHRGYYLAELDRLLKTESTLLAGGEGFRKGVAKGKSLPSQRTLFET